MTTAKKAPAKAKKKLSQKQLDALAKGRATRAANKAAQGSKPNPTKAVKAKPAKAAKAKPAKAAKANPTKSPLSDRQRKALAAGRAKLAEKKAQAAQIKLTPKIFAELRASGKRGIGALCDKAEKGDKSAISKCQYEALLMREDAEFQKKLARKASPKPRTSKGPISQAQRDALAKGRAKLAAQAKDNPTKAKKSTTKKAQATAAKKASTKATVAKQKAAKRNPVKAQAKAAKKPGAKVTRKSLMSAYVVTDPQGKMSVVTRSARLSPIEDTLLAGYTARRYPSEALARAAVKKASSKNAPKKAPKKTYVCKTKPPVAKGKLTPAKRAKLPKVLFALPKTEDLPIHDAGHTKSAMGRLTQMYNAKTITDAQYREAWVNIKAAADCFGIAMHKAPLIPITAPKKAKAPAKKAAKKATPKPKRKPASKKAPAKKATTKVSRRGAPKKIKLWTGTSSNPPPGYARVKAQEVRPSETLLATNGDTHKVQSVTHGTRTTLHFHGGSEVTHGHGTSVMVKRAAKKRAAKKASPKAASYRTKAQRQTQAKALETLKDAWVAQYKSGPNTSQSVASRISTKIANAMSRAQKAGAGPAAINKAMDDALKEARKSTKARPKPKSARKSPPKRKTARKAPPKRKTARKAPPSKRKAAPKAKIARVFIDQPDALAILSTLEGRTWARRQERDKLDVTGFYSNLDAYKHLDEAGLTDAEVELSEILAGSGEIYGTKGTIYTVHPNGEITLLHGSVKATKRARAENLGIRVAHGTKPNPVEPDDGNLDTEMETGALISESRDGYALAVEQEYITSADSVDESLEILRDWMQRNKYYPNVYFVNERGNVKQLDVATGKTIRSWT
jgi:hypothetical protein